MNKLKIKSIYIKMQKLFNNIEEDYISEFSAQCAYYTILSFIPFVILVITSIQYTGIGPETLFDAISKIVPSSMNEMVLGIVQEVYSKSIGTISISIIFIIWSAGNGLYALTKGLQSIYNIDDKEDVSYIYLRVKVIIETIIFIILIIIGLVALVFGDRLKNIVQENFNWFENYNIIVSILTKMGFIFATFIVFLLLYKFMPKHKVSIKSQIYGAIFGAISLNIVSYVFSIYLDLFKGFSITYGSLTTLILVMMWTYACFYTIFLGAEINKFLKFSKE